MPILLLLVLLAPALLGTAQEPGRPPILFEQNAGQLPQEARFLSRQGELTAFFTDQGARLVLADSQGGATALFLELEGARPQVPQGVAPLATRVNSYRGSDPSAWVTGAATFETVSYPEAAPGVELRFTGRDGQLAYDLVLAPGARLDPLVLRCDGADALSLDAMGGLNIATAAGTLRQSPPVAWETDADGGRHPVDAHFVLLDAQRWSFAVPQRQDARALVIDPGLSWGTHLGGSLADRAEALALTSNGHVIVVGTTGSPNFPTTPGAVQGNIKGFNDAFVARINPATGQLVFATYLGGTDLVIFRPDVAEDVMVAADGSLVLAGTAASADFPTTAGAFQQTSSGGSDAFVARFSASGTLLWSTLLGGAGNDEGRALALDAEGRPTVVGLTFHGSFPTTAGAYDTSFNSIALTNDGFVSRLTADGSGLVFSTFLGGALREELRDVVLDGTGRPVVVGLSGSSNWPTTAGTFDASFNGSGSSETDAVVARLSADGSTLQWSTYLGSAEITEGNALALTADGSVVVAGETRGADFPVTAGAFQTTFGGGACDGFITRFSADGASLTWSSFLGGAKDDALMTLALTSGDQATVAGESNSPELMVLLLPGLPGGGSLGSASGAGVALGAGLAPVPGSAAGSTSLSPIDLSLGGNRDGLLARLSVAGDRVLWASFYGGSSTDDVAQLVLDGVGAAWIAGRSDSVDLPLAGTPTQATAQGSFDAFVARFDLPPVSLLLSGPPPGQRGLRLETRGAFERGLPWSVAVAGALPGDPVFVLAGPAQPGLTRHGLALVSWPPALIVSGVADMHGGFTLGGAHWSVPSLHEFALQAWSPGLPPSGAVLISTP